MYGNYNVVRRNFFSFSAIEGPQQCGWVKLGCREMKLLWNPWACENESIFTQLPSIVHNPLRVSRHSLFMSVSVFSSSSSISIKHFFYLIQYNLWNTLLQRIAEQHNTCDTTVCKVISLRIILTVLKSSTWFINKRWLWWRWIYKACTAQILSNSPQFHHSSKRVEMSSNDFRIL